MVCVLPGYKLSLKTCFLARGPFEITGLYLGSYIFFSRVPSRRMLPRKAELLDWLFYVCFCHTNKEKNIKQNLCSI